MQLKNRTLAVALAVVGASWAFSAQAQYTGPANSPAASVDAILKAPKDDQDVVLRGHLLRKTGNEKYVFSDGTGEIIAEIDDDDMPNEPVSETTTVELRGEVDTGRNRAPEIEVDSVRIVR
ncbi:NirD/YgiW/YdeI family stress tolerance protein [Achromobacter sp. F4_2707]|uniref:NirD/YgiW/YdeI family stress tolerance protein n=1 Tax=Achromobacter sp. F4_2707 TaxID=3114286 RepID=UPI0039C5CC96